MTKRRRNFKNEFSYRVTITDWDVRASFNDYAYINIFDRGPFEESGYIVLSGILESTMSKKVKEGLKAEVVLHLGEWKKIEWEDRELPIGDIAITRSPRQILARVSVPPKTFDLVKSYMMYQPKGQVQLVGTELERSKGEIFYFSFDSQKYEESL